MSRFCVRAETMASRSVRTFFLGAGDGAGAAALAGGAAAAPCGAAWARTRAARKPTGLMKPPILPAMSTPRRLAALARIRPARRVVQRPADRSRLLLRREVLDLPLDVLLVVGVGARRKVGPELLDGLGALPALLVPVAEVPVRHGVLGFRRRGLLVPGHRLPEPLGLVHRPCNEEVDVDARRVALERPLVVRHRLRGLPGPGLAASQVDADRLQARGQLERLLVQRNGLLAVALLGEEPAELLVALRRSG